MSDQEKGPQKKMSMRKKAAHHIKVKCTDKVANAANLIACGVLMFAAIMRLVHCFSGGFDLWFFVLTFYFMSFIILIGFAEILYLKPDNLTSLKVRTYFNFLNKLVGRGLFLIFLSMIMV
jgi:hypothetical protein